jgi:DNA-binding CsgD family transcriptional regulator
MDKEIDIIKKVNLEVSRDGLKYSSHKELKGEDLKSSINFVPNTLEFMNGLLAAGRSICKEKKYLSFRVKVIQKKGTFYLYDSFSEQAESKTKVEASIPDEEFERYDSLTKKERQILCFLYRGYEQDAIAYVFGVTVHSVKKHRQNIYKKARFRNRTELAVWCEKYLHSMFKMSA